MSKNKNETFRGPLATHLNGIVEERHRMGFKFGEEERLLYELDRMSVDFDCQKGLTEELVRKFIERKPNWHQGTQEHHVHAVGFLHCICSGMTFLPFLWIIHWLNFEGEGSKSNKVYYTIAWQ